MGHDKVSNRALIENTEKLHQEDFTKIMQENYLNSQRQKDMVKNMYSQHVTESISTSTDLLGLNEVQQQPP